MTGSGADSGQRDRISVSSFARQSFSHGTLEYMSLRILCDCPFARLCLWLSVRLSELAFWAAVALCSFLVAQLLYPMTWGRRGKGESLATGEHTQVV